MVKMLTGRDISSTGGAVTGGRSYLACCKPESVLVKRRLPVLRLKQPLLNQKKNRAKIVGG
jgi:hypothetical protein